MITIDVDADDADGSVTSVEIFNGDVSLGTASKVSAGAVDYRFNLQTSLTDLGDLQLNARATDDSGNVSISTSVVAKVVTGAVPTVTIDSPSPLSDEVPIFNYGNVIPFVITAFDPDGSISSVSVSHLDNGTATALGQALKVDFASDDQYRYSLNTAVLTAGTKFISVSAVDNSGNVSTDVVEIRLDVVPFSVNFVTQTATDTAPGFITTPTASPYIIEGASSEFFSARRGFTVEIGGIDPSTLAFLDWKTDGAVTLLLDDGSAAVSVRETLVAEATEDGQPVAEVASSTYTQEFIFTGTGTLTVTATNSDGVTVQNSLTVFVDLPALEGDTPASRAAFAATLFPSDEYNNSLYQTVALVYKTLTGQWPNQAQLETGLSTILQDTAAQSNQTIVPLSGSITAGGTQILNTNYSAGDEVTISVTGDGTNGNPLNDATLTVRAPDGSFVGYSDDNFLSGNFSFDPALSFVASQTGAYTITVGGYNSFQSGDFVATSTSTATESDTNTLAARALVESLKGSYNGANGFLANDATDPAFLAQIYLNKHGVGITSFNASLLNNRLKGVDIVKISGDILPGYQGNVVNFVADFALDVDLTTGLYASFTTADGYHYSKIVYYGRPNNPLSSWDQARAEIQSDANLNSALSALLGIQNPTDLDLAPYVGMTLEEALAEIFTADQYVGFAAATDSFVAKRMLKHGIVDGTKAGANDDADGDGVSNIVEILLMQDPTSVASSPGSVQTSTEVTGNATYFVMEFVRVKPSLTPGVKVELECAESLGGPFMPVSNVESKLSSDGINQPADTDYERVEFRVDTSSIDCNFFRLSVEPVESVQ
jgi:hypothetical protein